MKTVYIKAGDTISYQGQSQQAKIDLLADIPDEAQQFDSEGVEIVMYVER